VSNTLNVTGEKLVASGTCLARTPDGLIAFVDGLLPGETATVHEIEGPGKTTFAAIDTIETASDIRVNPPCEFVAAGCGGCDWQHIRIDEQPQLKRDIVIDALSRVGKFDNASDMVEPTIILDTERYRTTARVLATSSQWGFRQEHSHDMVPVTDCMVLHPECVHQASDVMASIDGDDIHEAQLRRSPDPFFGKQLTVSPGSFYQSHIDAANTLANIVVDFVESFNSQFNCVDLYGGVGIFSVALSQHGHRVLCVESNRQAVEDAEVNLADESAYVLKCDVNTFEFGRQHFLSTCDVVVADPSREGLGKNGVRAVMSCDPDHIVLISCDPASGARDIKALVDQGFKVNDVTPIDMFAYTHHVEMVTTLSRFI
jgi:23S rRNA (uracil1939-C5)-methyltransferase